MRLIAGILLLALLSGSVYSQTADAPSAIQSAPAFDIADVHTSPARRFAFLDGGNLRGDRYVLRQATMVDLIAAAYKEQADNVQGGPSWLETDRFDVFAKAPASTPTDQVKLMLRSLLADRFKLVVHNGSKPMPAFVLSAGSGKPKLKEAEDTANSGCNPSQQTSDPGTVPYIFVSCRNVTMEAFAQALHDMAGGYLTKIVVDSTGLKGSWDFDLKWTGRGNLARAGADGISIFDAVDKQLGLKLELQTAPRPVLIVDSVNEQPTANPPDLKEKLPPLPPPQFDVSVIKPSKSDEQFNGKGRDARRTCLLLQRGSDFVGPETSCAPSAGGVPGTSHQWERGAYDPVAIPARGGVGHAGELPGPACRSDMGRPHSWDSRGKEEDRGDRRNRLPACADLGNDRGSA